MSLANDVSNATLELAKPKTIFSDVVLELKVISMRRLTRRDFDSQTLQMKVPTRVKPQVMGVCKRSNLPKISRVLIDQVERLDSIPSLSPHRARYDVFGSLQFVSVFFLYNL